MKPFKNIAGLRPRRSVFNNSYYKVLDANLGEILPIMCDLFLPGDMVKIGAEALVRANPLVAPIMHRIDLKADYWAVPLRLLFPKPDYKDDEGNSLGYTLDTSSFEEFITGGVTGKLEPTQPKWIPTEFEVYTHSLWDYLGFPIGIVPPGGINAYPKRAYNLIYNENFRAQDFEDPVDLDDSNIHLAKWEKDYFTSALPMLQRGTAPSMPLTGIANAQYSFTPEQFTFVPADGQPYPYASLNMYWNEVRTNRKGTFSTFDPAVPDITASENTITNLNNFLNDNQINLENLGTFTAEDIRWIFQIQRHMERSMRAGSRLTEYLQAHWGVSNGDARLQRPEYIGGIRSPVIISEVLQTSDTNNTTPQGNMAGHAISTTAMRVGSYYCREHTIIIGVMRLMPKPVYQQGINRQWLYETRWDYPTPEFVHLGEQEIFNMELMTTANDEQNKDIFGYQGRYDEHRVKQNMICGRMRSTAEYNLDHWHLARYFAGSSPPKLNKEFLDVVDDQRYSAVQNEKGWIVTYGNNIRRVAPLPIVGTPGLIDHN